MVHPLKLALAGITNAAEAAEANNASAPLLYEN
jgi:hypothetical protein